MSKTMRIHNFYHALFIDGGVCKVFTRKIHHVIGRKTNFPRCETMNVTLVRTLIATHRSLLMYTRSSERNYIPILMNTHIN